MQEQKKYHQRKLAIIEMIEECDLALNNQRNFLISMPSVLAMKNTEANIRRYHKIKQYLTERYNRN